ncbi:MAG: ATP-dependent Clp protease ATP-binding subunit [Candidatus Nomurabacteria bacterium]|nr:ATP-dependent Clp protease ATP-binding subunit [Candidatus Nomurabacteria bacterium]USN87437.1 MAG: ATP-dependent Clp protease ATP-binding subunit [Candidatus Nomurabacteria bacterium]
MYTLAEDIKKYAPVLSLVKILSRRTLSTLRIIFFTLAVIAALVAVGFHYFIPTAPISLLLGISLIFSGLWLEQLLIFSYHNSYYFFGLNSIIGLEDENIAGATYEVAEAIGRQKNDITKAFCTSRLGTIVLLRAGISADMLDTFFRSQRALISTDMVPLPSNQIFTLITLGKYILQQDSAFKKLLKENGVADEIFVGSLEWVVGSHLQEKRLERWWGKDNLSKTQGIGREWAFGTAYILQKFSRSLQVGAVYSGLSDGDSAFTNEKIEEIEVALARAKASNVLIIGEAGVGKIDLLLEVNRRIRLGKSLSAIENKQMILLDTSRLFATHHDKQALELTILQLFTEATKAGNVIMVIENLSTLIREAEAMGVFIPELIDPYLATDNLHVVATDTPGSYHTHLEPLGAFARRFAEVLIDEPNLASTTRVLQGVALQNENRYQTLFTYAALKAVTESADRYIVEGKMPDKAIELLIDIATRANQAGVGVITDDYVYQVVSDKTGIPAGPIEEKERDLLLNLEDRLHERVIGQLGAIDAIAGTMRRARAGIQSADKPIGSFLFLGPTGVGKTETAKALAFVFFGDENKMHRIDMSEFSGEDALERLIGNGEESGILPDMLREHPYAVLLLDEFEKGSKAVHDVFLQILDEGVFTDARGERVNARNTIIIATSNAGSQLIMDTIEQRKELSTLQQEIVDHIIKEGIYRPELVNRFDNTIIFEPLKIEEQGQVAGLMLKGLYERIKDKGYELVVTRDLMDVLVEKGYDPQFGARPMQRVLQNLIEEKVAEKMISGEVKEGDTITLTKADFSEAELSN